MTVLSAASGSTMTGGNMVGCSGGGSLYGRGGCSTVSQWQHFEEAVSLSSESGRIFFFFRYQEGIGRVSQIWVERLNCSFHFCQRTDNKYGDLSHLVSSRRAREMQWGLLDDERQFLKAERTRAVPGCNTLPEVLLTEPGLWEWADSQHWPEISSSNWISRRGGAITHTERSDCESLTHCGSVEDGWPDSRVSEERGCVNALSAETGCDCGGTTAPHVDPCPPATELTIVPPTPDDTVVPLPLEVPDPLPAVLRVLSLASRSKEDGKIQDASISAVERRGGTIHAPPAALVNPDTSRPREPKDRLSSSPLAALGIVP
ncbi:hypothetical protein INR49_022204, partial [Caranx melampygus]